MDAAGYDERFKSGAMTTCQSCQSPLRYVLAPGKEDAFENLRCLMARPDVDTAVNACDAGCKDGLIFSPGLWKWARQYTRYAAATSMNASRVSGRSLSPVRITSPNGPKIAGGGVQKRACDFPWRLFGGSPYGLCGPPPSDTGEKPPKTHTFSNTKTGARPSVRPRATLPVVFYSCFASYPKQSRGNRPKSFAIIMLQKPITVLQSEIIDIPPRMLAIMLQSPITYL